LSNCGLFTQAHLHRFEPVQAQHQQGHRRRLPLPQRTQLVEQLDQQGAVGQAGRQVDRPGTAHFEILLLALHRQPDRAHQSGALRVLHRDHILHARVDQAPRQFAVRRRPGHDHGRTGCGLGQPLPRQQRLSLQARSATDDDGVRRMQPHVKGQGIKALAGIPGDALVAPACQRRSLQSQVAGGDEL
jgi:hypothetical protein